jgi:hypothetical protein
MPTRTLTLIASVVTVLFLIVLSILLLFVNVIALNGVSERQGFTAMTLSLICQGISVILAAILASWLTGLLHEKFGWYSIVAVMVAVLAGTSLGAMFAFLAMVISIPIAGIR